MVKSKTANSQDMKLDLKLVLCILVLVMIATECDGFWGSSRSRSSSRSSSSRSSSTRRSGGGGGGFWGSRRSSSRSSSRSTSSSRRSTSKSYPHDVKSKSKLTNIYNEKVVHAQKVERPLTRWSKKVGPFKHSGVVVTTTNGNRYLVHKGSGYGKSSQTVVVNARHMGNKWSAVKSKSVTGAKVGDYVKAGGKKYNVLTDNCHSASGRNMKLGKTP